MSEPGYGNQGGGVPGGGGSDLGLAQWVYILYLVGLIVGITSLIGVVMAYVSKDDAPEWLRSHYTFQIHTFWKGLLYSVIGLILIPALGIGILVLLAVAVWLIVRCVKGLNKLSARQPYPDPRGWAF